MTASLNALWQGYLKAVGWIEDHPHLTFWAGSGAVIAALVL